MMEKAAFCPQCGHSLARCWTAGRERPVCLHCGFIQYWNPAPAALGLVLDGKGGLLLTKRAHPPLQGYWAPPAGYVEVDENVEEALRREIREETGIEVETQQLLGIYSKSGMGILILVYRCRAVGGTLQASEEATEVAFFDAAALPLEAPHPAFDGLDRWVYEVVHELLLKVQRGLS